MKKLLTVLFVTFSFLLTYSQKEIPIGCGTDEIHQKQLEDNSDYKVKFEDNSYKWQEYAIKESNKTNNQSRTFPIEGVILSIAIHDVSSNGSYLLPSTSNIDDYQYIITALNGLYAPINIQFCLAKKDNAGDEYSFADTQSVSDSSYNLDRFDDTAKLSIVNDSGAGDRFNREHYINIYIVDSIGGNVAGFASMPSAHGTDTDGIFIERGWLDNINLSDDIKVLVHELGHYLGLFHTFQYTFWHDDTASCDVNYNCLNDGDMVCDTPPHLNPLETDPAGGCFPTNTCSDLPVPTITDGNHSPTEMDDPIHNYMNYTPHNCKNEFTPGQRTRMQFMVDPDWGPRKSLLGNAECIDCISMNNCEFNIEPSINLINPRHYNEETNNVTFSASNDCGLSTPADIIYTWTLIELENNTDIFADSNFASTSGLAIGNYQLILTATDSSEPLCIETVEYYFTIIPPLIQQNCLETPNDNNSWGDWINTSSTINTLGTEYIEDSTVDLNGFDVVAVTPGGNFTDNNFNITLPTTANINNVMRVGNINDDSTGGGKNYYTQIILPISLDNCRFKIWYLGGSHSSGYVQKRVENTHSNFGWNCEYNYNSQVFNDQSDQLNMTIGSTINFNEGVNIFDTNDFRSHSIPSFSNPPSYTETNGFFTLDQWQSKIIDFSEFANLNPATEITLTFYAKSNVAINAFENAYAYYGIECLGGGFPSNVILDIPDQVIGCNNNGLTGKINIDLPIPSYFQNGGWTRNNNENNYNFDNVELLYWDGSNWETYDFTLRTFNIILSINPDNYNQEFLDFKMFYTTINGVIEDEFRVYFNFNIDFTECDTGNEIAPIALTNPPGVNQDGPLNDANFVVTSGGVQMQICDDLPTPLSLTMSCIEEQNILDTYVWTCKGYNNRSQNVWSYTTSMPENNTWDLTQAEDYYGLLIDNLPKIGRLEIQRVAKYRDIYCEQPTEQKSDIFTIYNTSAFDFTFEGVTPNEVCFNQNVDVSDPIEFIIRNINLSKDRILPIFLAIPGYSEAQDNTDPTIFVDNNFIFQLRDPITNQDFGPEIIYNFDNLNNYTANNQLYKNKQIKRPSIIDALAYDFEGASIPQPEGELSFVFKNSDPSSPTQPLFTPLNPGLSTYDLQLHITGTYGGCEIDRIIEIDSFNLRASAVGGEINYDCDNQSINNNSDINSVSANGEYHWEYLTTNNLFLPIPGAPISIDFPNINSYNNLPNATNPLVIRRVSLGFGDDCYSNDYSNQIELLPQPDVPLITVTQACNTPATVLLSNLPSTDWELYQNGDLIASGNTTTYSITDIEAGTHVFNIAHLHGCLSDSSIEIDIVDGFLSTPVINTIIQPSCDTTNIGSVALSNLPTGNWIITPILNGTPLTTINGNSNNDYLIPNLQAGTYTFTVSQDGCTSLESDPIDILDVTIVTPIFNLPNSICVAETLPILPLISTNGISGTWSPAVVNVTINNYTFTPEAGECAISYDYEITFLPSCTGLALEWGEDVSCQLADFRFKPTDDIVDGPCIRVCENTRITYEITGDIGSISSIDWFVTGGNIRTESGTSCTINWTNLEFANLNIVIHYVNGDTTEINRCIEKLNAPNALFTVLPDGNNEQVYVCVNNQISFENLTTANGGHDSIYYNWDFADGNTSNEFEPTHTFNDPGTYKVVLQAFNGCSCIGEHALKVVVEESNIAIICPSMACEGERTNYSVSSDFANCELEWSIIGGEIAWQNDPKNEISVIWNNIDDSGFGYVTVSANGCFNCNATVRIPVVQNTGTIKGDLTLCENAQGLYTLPQWATTDFDWQLKANGTGAQLLPGNTQRNEIIIQTGTPGTISLSGTYYNTLLGCGGVAGSIEINVQPAIELLDFDNICTNTEATFTFQTLAGQTVSTINWEIFGPEQYHITGTNTPIVNTFPTEGAYSIYATSPNYCIPYIPTILVNESPITPNSIQNEGIEICPGVPMTYSVTAPAQTTAHWLVSGGSILGSDIGNQITVNFDATFEEDYTISVWYEKDGCESPHYDATINVDIPDLQIPIGETSLCGSTRATYRIQDIEVDNFIWSIDPETAGSIEQGQNTNEIEILWNQPQNGTQTADVKITVRKCGKNQEEILTVSILEQATVTNTTTDMAACVDQPFAASFSLDTGFTLDEVSWDFGDGTPIITNTSMSFDHEYRDPLTTSTTYIVTVRVTANGCTPAVITFPVIVSPSPEVNISPTDVNFCQDTDVIEIAVNDQNGFASTDTVQWYVDGVAVSAPNPIPISNDGANHTYYAVVTNSLGCSETTQKTYVIGDCGGSGCNGSAGPDPSISYILNECDSATVYTSYPGNPTVSWDLSNIPDEAIIVDNGDHLSITNLPVGNYPIRLYTNYGQCSSHAYTSILVPYQADLKYQVTCNDTNDNYTVTLLDHSVSYSDATMYNLQNVIFTVDGNQSVGSVVSGTAQKTYSLAPGNTYQVGIRIMNYSGWECTKTIPLVLPELPNASFNFDNNACQATAIQFTPDVLDTNLTYEWNFGFGVFNLQPEPVRAFATAGSFPVILTVTNQYGCSDTKLHMVTVVPESIVAGILAQTPISACEGNSVTLSLNFLGVGTVTGYEWYYNSRSNGIIATTPTITVTESGQYFIYAQSDLGCWNYDDIFPISVAFIPDPLAPVVTGVNTACLNSEVVLQVPETDSLSYTWSFNGVPQDLDNQHQISFTANQTGMQTVEVTAHTVSDNGVSCTGETTTHQVFVFDALETPQIEISQLSCEPYQVSLSVANPQDGVAYYWSNGSSGSQAISTHSGPIQVRAEANGCSVVNQIDLPIDLTNLAWSFPSGCYDFCGKELPKNAHIIGPLGNFEHWSWNENNHSIQDGNGLITPLYDISIGNEYQLALATEDCNTTYENTSINHNRKCDKCKIEIVIERITCTKINGITIYAIDVVFENNMDIIVNTHLNVPNTEGYFVSSTFTLYPGENEAQLYFFPSNNFEPNQNMLISLNGSYDEGVCYSETNINLPNCNDLERSLANNIMILQPNPAKEKTEVWYSITTKGELSLQVSDMLGTIYHTEKLKTNKGAISLDLRSFSFGVYDISILKNGNPIVHQKIIKE